MSGFISRNTPRIDWFAASLANGSRIRQLGPQPTKKYQEPWYASLGRLYLPGIVIRIDRLIFVLRTAAFISLEPSRSCVDFCRPFWKIIPKKQGNVNQIDQFKHDSGFAMIFTDPDYKSSLFWNFVLHWICYNWHHTDPVYDPKRIWSGRCWGLFWIRWETMGHKWL